MKSKFGLTEEQQKQLDRELEEKWRAARHNYYSTERLLEIVKKEKEHES